MELREAAEKELATSIQSAFDEVTKVRDELRKMQGITDFSSISDENLLVYRGPIESMARNLPITWIVLVILANQLKVEDSV